MPRAVGCHKNYTQRIKFTHTHSHCEHIARIDGIGGI